MASGEASVIIMGLVILSGAGLLMGAMITRRKVREMEHRERLAMIERGLVPPPEMDLLRFEAGTGFTHPHQPEHLTATAIRYRTGGVLLIGLGLGLMLLIAFTSGRPDIGVGIGGAWAILGAASLVNYFLMMRRDEPRSGPPVRWAPPPSPPQGHEPPANIAP